MEFKVIIAKGCLKEVKDEEMIPGLIADKYVHVSVFQNDSMEPCCWVGTDDDWELSFTGEDAEYKFMLVLEQEKLSVQYLLSQGFSQYG